MMQWPCRLPFLLLAGPLSSWSATSAADPHSEIDFTRFSRLDFFWGCTHEGCLARGNGIIAKAIQLAGQSLLVPVSVVDRISPKSLPATQSFCSVTEDLVVSALNLDSSLLPRIFLRAGPCAIRTIGFEVPGR